MPVADRNRLCMSKDMTLPTAAEFLWGRPERRSLYTAFICGLTLLFVTRVAPAQETTVIISVTETPPDQVQEAPPPRPTGAKSYPLPIEPIVKQKLARDYVDDLSKAAPALPPAPQEDQIDLSTALRLAERQNPNIAAARQAILFALAKQLEARSMPFPHLRTGLNYHKHDGILQTSFGLMRHVESESLYFGAGARTLAAETVAFPGVQFLNHLGDLFFEPLVARQFVTVTQFEATAVSNTVLLEVASRYLDLLTAEGELTAVTQSETEMNLIVQTTEVFARTGRGREANARRARTAALLLHIQKQALEERTAVAAAELARVLHLDPSTRLRSPARNIALMQLVDQDYSLQQLIQLAQNARPELAAIRAEIARKNTQVRQERARPFLPTLAVNYSAGAFGGGTNRSDLVPVHPEFGRIGSRADFDVLAYWTLQGMGAGNIALARKRMNEREIAQVDELRLINQVRREVAAAKAQVEARRQEIDTALLRLDVAEKSFREDYERIRGNLGLPIEVLDSIDRLVASRLNLIQVLAGYNLAQFQLFVAVGQTPLAAAPNVE
jgi:outer membrane protein TolC